MKTVKVLIRLYLGRVQVQKALIQSNLDLLISHWKMDLNNVKHA